MHRARVALASILAILMLLSQAVPAQADPPDPDWSAFESEDGPSHASGGRPDLGKHLVGNPNQAVKLLRIGLRRSTAPAGGRCSEFVSFNHTTVRLTSTTSDFHVIDRATGRKVASAAPGTEFAVAYDQAAGAYVVSAADGTAAASVAGPVYFQGSGADNGFRLTSLLRTNIFNFAGPCVVPEYRGDIEIARGTATPAGQLNVVNIVELEAYLRGNVVNESPASFHVEALKTQAVAARGYAVANIGRFVRLGWPFDLDDSAGSQVYRGRLSEHPNGDAAVAGTTGLVTSYEGRIISAFYSSSMAGNPENVEWSFSSVGDPSNARPYLVGRYDGPAGTEPDLTTEAGRRAFWEGAQPQVHDSQASSGNPRNRWRYDWPRTDFERVLNAIRANARVVSGSTMNIGTLRSCVITRSSPTGRAVVVRCEGSSAVWEFVNWDNVRRAVGRRLERNPTTGVISTSGLVLNNPAFIDLTYDAAGTLQTVTTIGGGWGQYGANGRGRAGQHFGEILTFYYKDTAIGSFPVDIAASTRVVRQAFVSPTGAGILELRPGGGIEGLRVVLNDTHDLHFSAADLAVPVLRIDVSAYLVPGANTIQYNPQGKTGAVTALVEVYR